MGYNLSVDRKKVELQIKQLSSQTKSVYLARDLINEPANLEKTETFITIIQNYIKKHKLPVKLTVLEEKQLERMGMGLLLGVGAGSNLKNRPKLLILEYYGSQKFMEQNKITKPEYILMGKGITFDTGGLDLKGSKSMVEMKTDLSGAATVYAFLLGYAMNAGEKCITCICTILTNKMNQPLTPLLFCPQSYLTLYTTVY